MTNMIRKTTTAVKGGPGGTGIWSYAKYGVSRFAGRIFVDRKGGTPEPIATTAVNVLADDAAAITLDGTDDGVTVVANNSAATVVVTLPAAATVGAGFKARVLTGVLPGAGAGTTVTPNAADKFAGNGFNAKTAGQTLVNSAATDAIGDLVQVISNGVDTWFVVAKVGTWA